MFHKKRLVNKGNMLYKYLFWTLSTCSKKNCWDPKPNKTLFYKQLKTNTNCWYAYFQTISVIINLKISWQILQQYKTQSKNKFKEKIFCFNISFGINNRGFWYLKNCHYLLFLREVYLWVSIKINGVFETIWYKQSASLKTKIG